ncbi:MAG: chemotaxis protein CheW [Gammaproteobacteria bacterium]|nr:MAG: chemotaxis protein CheW [Gammaproteobacteria bacterium]RLA11336.1 MAG: chemotaxis protein CheW [Gammaproteobacteria bacterium]RLA12966.1 MAG: chemotaxis protein CheW [Gammaproteobacteria bacterium]
MSASPEHVSESTIRSESEGDQYLTFLLAGEEYGVSILRVQEIKGWDSATPLPNMPDYILGVINLRGTVVPVIELRKRFGLESIPFGPETVVIVVKVLGEDGKERTMSIVADAVSEVYDVADADLQPAPDFGGTINSTSVTGLATIDEKMIILLDIDDLMSADIPTLDESAD